MLKNNFKDLKHILEKKYELGLDNPITIIFLGHLILFLLAIPYYNEFGVNSLLKMGFFVSLNIFAFSIPFFINFEKFLKLDRINLILIITVFLFLATFYGIFSLFHSVILALAFLGVMFLILGMFIKYYDSKNAGKLMFTIGILSFIWILLNYGAVPILDYNVRMAISNDPLRLISSGALIFASFFSFWYFIISFGVLTLTGYKANVIGLVAAYLLYNYKIKKIGSKKIVIIGIIMVIFLGIMAKLILASSGQVWKLNFLEILSYRAYFDLMTLEKILNVPEILFGKIAFTPGGESLIGKIIHGYTHNITSTMFGPIYLDLGYYSVIFSLIFGIISKLIYKKSDTKIYSIYGAVLLSMCEIGINYGFLVTLLVFLYVSENLQKKPKIS